MNVLTIADIDRYLLFFLNGSDSLFYDNFMSVLTSGFTWIPLYIALLAIVIKNNETMTQILLIVGCALLCVVIADGVADFRAKPCCQRWLRCNDPIIEYDVQVVGNERGGKYGFFSAHAANTFSLALFFCMLVRNKLLTTVMLGWSLLNCYTRIYLGMHYPGDIVCGIAWGAVSGLIAYGVYFRIYYRISPKINYVSTQYSSTGYDLSDICMVALVFLFILMYALLRALI